MARRRWQVLPVACHSDGVESTGSRDPPLLPEAHGGRAGWPATGAATNGLEPETLRGAGRTNDITLLLPDNLSRRRNGASAGRKDRFDAASTRGVRVQVDWAVVSTPGPAHVVPLFESIPADQGSSDMQSEDRTPVIRAASDIVVSAAT